MPRRYFGLSTASRLRAKATFLLPSKRAKCKKRFSLAINAHMQVAVPIPPRNGLCVFHPSRRHKTPSCGGVQHRAAFRANKIPLTNRVGYPELREHGNAEENAVRKNPYTEKYVYIYKIRFYCNLYSKYISLL